MQVKQTYQNVRFEVNHLGNVFVELFVRTAMGCKDTAAFINKCSSNLPSNPDIKRKEEEKDDQERSNWLGLRACRIALPVGWLEDCPILLPVGWLKTSLASHQEHTRVVEDESSIASGACCMAPGSRKEKDEEDN